jgi:uncharacterized protein YqeY
MKGKINQDLKAAMLARDSFLVDTLKGLKSAILNQEIAENKREAGLSDSEVETLLAKEAKKREEAAGLYEKGGNSEMADKERREKAVIEKYLPEQLNEEEIGRLVEEAIQQTGAKEPKDMGKVIGAVKAKAGNSADGSIIAKLAKAKLQ